MVHTAGPGPVEPAQQYEGMSLRDVYRSSCAALDVKPNSRLLWELSGEVSSFTDTTVLDVSRNFLGERGFQAFLEVVRLNSRLEKLVLAENGLANDAVVALCRVAAEHGGIRHLDLRGNHISLTGGQALLDLTRRCASLMQIDLQNTNIDDRLFHRISRGLERNAALAKKPPVQGETPFEKTKREHQERRRERMRNMIPEAKKDELLNTVAKVLSRRQIKAPKRARGGWVILSVYISATQADFMSELHRIHKVIIPMLNKKLRDRKVHLQPFALHQNECAGSQKQAAGAKRKKATLHQTVAALELVRHCGPVFTSLLGDRHGAVPVAIPQDPVYEQLRAECGADECPPQAVLEVLHGGLLNESSVPLYFLRCPTHRLRIPEGIIETMTDDYRYRHPDPEGHIMLVSASERDDTAKLDPSVQVKRWEQLQSLRRRVASSVPSPLLLPCYDAQFSKVSENGQVLLSKLDVFEQEYSQRLWEVVTYLYPNLPEPETPDDVCGMEWKELDLRNELRERFIYGCPYLFGRKNTLGKADLYVVSPASRNILLLHGPRGAGATALMATFAGRALKRGSFEVAYHFVGNGLLADESRDLRTVLLSLCKQLLPEKKLPPHIQNEVNLHSIKDFWKQTLAKTSAGLKEGSILLLIIDSLDMLEAPVEPPQELVQTDTGRCILGGGKPGDAFDWIPICLPKNVRLVGSVLTDSPAFETLCRRGQDSCEPLPLPVLGNVDVEGVIVQRLQWRGVTLRQEEIVEIVSKQHTRHPRYLQIICDRIVMRWDRGPPLDAHRMAFLRALPGTLSHIVDDTLDAADEACGAELVGKMLSAVALSPDGLLELQLREHLHPPVGREVADGGPTPLLSGSQWALVKYYTAPLMQPLLTTVMSDAAARQTDRPVPEHEPVNGLSCRMQISCRGTAETIMKRYLPTEADKRKAMAGLAGYFHALSERGSHPLTFLGVKDAPRMMVGAGMWSKLVTVVFSVRFLRLAFEHSLGYCLFREMLRAYTVMQGALKSGSDAGLLRYPESEVRGWQFKMREYVHFIHSNLHALAARPRLAIQQGLSAPTDSTIYMESRAYYTQHTNETYFLWVNKDRRKVHRDAVTAATFAPNGLRVVTGAADRSVAICNTVGDVVHHIGGGGGVVTAMLSRTSRYVLAAYEDRTLGVYDATTGMPVSKLVGHAGQIKCTDMSARGRFVLSGSEDRSLRLWESETGRAAAEISHTAWCSSSSPHSAVSCCAAHPSDEGICMSGVDRVVLIWRIAPDFSHTLIGQLTAHSQWPVTNCMWRAEGAHILTMARRSAAQGTVATRDTAIKLWSASSCECVSRFNETQEESLLCVCLSRCHGLVAASSDNGNVSVWSLRGASEVSSSCEGVECPIVQPMFTIAAHGRRCALLSFSHNSAHLASAGADGLLRVWQLPDGQLSAEYVVEAAPRSLDFTPCPLADGGELVVGDAAGHTYLLTCHNFATPAGGGALPAPAHSKDSV
eukprot:TRINITY_DN1231_c1_g2_i1.p1 TRINITY_DN1231_c1_g2~~TRINITY_DN1231_c1_g2_i1.p1  ORF type:complete len:1498 (+),score=358.81 TRINITY_DN1231_c1_g2_i1:63-4496(+)